jgi:hypothetical protein
MRSGDRLWPVQDRPEYALLQRVSHWTDEDVEREKRMSKQPDVRPNIVLEDSFSEILDHLEFVE